MLVVLLPLLPCGLIGAISIDTNFEVRLASVNKLSAAVFAGLVLGSAWLAACSVFGMSYNNSIRLAFLYVSYLIRVTNCILALICEQVTISVCLLILSGVMFITVRS